MKYLTRNKTVQQDPSTLFRANGLFILISLFLFFFVGCGRKQKNIFYFPEKKEEFRVNKLALETVKGVKAVSSADGNKITWQPVVLEEKLYQKKYPKELLGYNVYRLVDSSFVPKKSINTEPSIETKFVDKDIFNQTNLKTKDYSCYLVRAVFKINDLIVQGPSSRVVCEKNYPPT